MPTCISCFSLPLSRDLFACSDAYDLCGKNGRWDIGQDAKLVYSSLDFCIMKYILKAKSRCFVENSCMPQMCPELSKN